MNPPDATDAATKIHPGVWGLMAAGIVQAGAVAVAAIKSRMPGKEDKPDRLKEIMDGIGTIRENMATRTDLQRVEGKIDQHVQAHAEGKFTKAAS